MAERCSCGGQLRPDGSCRDDPYTWPDVQQALRRHFTNALGRSATNPFAATQATTTKAGEA